MGRFQIWVPNEAFRTLLAHDMLQAPYNTDNHFQMGSKQSSFTSCPLLMHSFLQCSSPSGAGKPRSFLCLGSSLLYFLPRGLHSQSCKELCRSECICVNDRGRKAQLLLVHLSTSAHDRSGLCAADTLGKSRL